MTARRVAIVGARPSATHGAPGRIVMACIAADVSAFMLTLPPGTIIVSGGAAGVDNAARLGAVMQGLYIVEHYPDYSTHGPRAPLARNTAIVDNATEVHAWPAPWSRGTWDTIRKARAAGKPCVVHEPWRGRAHGTGGGE